ncbi:MAG: cysteine desulfurase family protein, partial [Traorella sp.]
MIYFDSASTTPLHPEVLKTYKYLLETYYANSESLYDSGIKVNKLLEQSREQIAKMLHVGEDEIIFTSGASESNSMFIKGLALKYQYKGKHLITSNVEHSSVENAFRQLEDCFGFEVTYLPVNDQGKVDINTLKKALRKDTILVSIMAINNETGAINDLENLSKTIKENSIAFFHSDCTQALGKIELPLQFLDGASFSAHKIYGCKGSGFLYKKSSIQLLPLINGGQQEYGIRGGTSNHPVNIVLAKTIRIALESMNAHLNHVTKLNELMRRELNRMDDILINSPIDASPYILNFSCTCMTSEILLNALNEKKIYVSAKSTCHSKTRSVSSVLLAMGIDEKRASQAIRVSFSYLNTEKEVLD